VEAIAIKFFRGISHWIRKLSKRKYVALLGIVLLFPLLLEVISLFIVGPRRLTIVSIWLTFDGQIILLAILSIIRNNSNPRSFAYLYLLIIYTELLHSTQLHDLTQIGMRGPQPHYMTIGMSIMVIPVLVLIGLLIKRYWLRIGKKFLMVIKTAIWLHMFIHVMYRLFPVPTVGEVIWLPPPSNFLERTIETLFDFKYIESVLAYYLVIIMFYSVISLRCRENKMKDIPELGC